MREFRTYGSARGAEGNLCSYRNSKQEQKCSTRQLFKIPRQQRQRVARGALWRAALRAGG